MKKTYMKPATAVVAVVPQYMIASSGISFGDDTSGDALLNDDFALDPLSRSWDNLFWK